MNNNELRAQLLIEAADLLSESAGRNGMLKRMSDKNLLVPAAKDQADKIDNYKKEVTKQHGSISKTNSDIERYLKFCKLKGREPKKELIEKCKMINDNLKEHTRFIQDKNKSWRNKLESEISDHTRPVSKIHQKINKRAAIKESIDLLYDKAALCESAEETEYYINQALELSELL